MKSYTDEIWKDVVGWEGLYQVSSYGRVKSFRKKEPHVLSSCIGKHGYNVVLLHDGKGKRKNVTLKIGDTVTAVLFSGERVTGIVESIEICSEDSKYGRSVEECDIEKHRNGVVDLDCGHWCYFNQIQYIERN